MKKKPVDMFILAPAYFNVPYMKYSMEGAYTLTVEVEELKKLDNIDEFLYYNYHQAFYVKDMQMSELRL